jgi:hypothetical protein
MSLATTVMPCVPGWRTGVAPGPVAAAAAVTRAMHKECHRRSRWRVRLKRHGFNGVAHSNTLQTRCVRAARRDSLRRIKTPTVSWHTPTQPSSTHSRSLAGVLDTSTSNTNAHISHQCEDMRPCRVCRHVVHVPIAYATQAHKYTTLHVVQPGAATCTRQHSRSARSRPAETPKPGVEASCSLIVHDAPCLEVYVKVKRSQRPARWSMDGMRHRFVDAALHVARGTASS